MKYDLINYPNELAEAINKNKDVNILYDFNKSRIYYVIFNSEKIIINNCKFKIEEEHSKIGKLFIGVKSMIDICIDTIEPNFSKYKKTINMLPNDCRKLIKKKL